MTSDDEPQWSISNTVRRKMSDMFAGKVFGSANEQRNLAGQVKKHGRREMAFQMAGTRDTKSRSYKTARDNLGRWLKGTRKASSRSVDKVASASRSAQSATIQASGSMSVSMHATFITSRTSWVGTARGQLSGDQLERFLAATQQGDSETAARMVTQAYADGSGFDEYVTGIEDISGFNIE